MPPYENPFLSPRREGAKEDQKRFFMSAGFKTPPYENLCKSLLWRHIKCRPTEKQDLGQV